MVYCYSNFFGQTNRTDNCFCEWYKSDFITKNALAVILLYLSWDLELQAACGKCTRRQRRCAFPWKRARVRLLGIGPGCWNF